jgi:TonB-linked SusC/RagA family outer membrane protein
MIAQVSVKGVVTDSDGEPLIGVNILEQGTVNGTITDYDGTYSLDVASSASVLVYSYTGFRSQEVAVGNQTTLDVIMTESAELLDEVIVSALGFEIKKDETGTTASNVDPADIGRSGESTLLNSLGAKASNVQISRANGDPGAGSTIRIRGANSISGSSNPLIILDGVPIANNTQYGGGNDVTGGRTGGVSQQSRLNDINPNDIESVTILKGASAAALWGARAANGVLVITTKDGASGKPKISFKSTRSVDWVNQRYELQDTWGQGRGGVYSPTRAEAWGDYIPDRNGGADVVDQSGQYFEAEDGTLYYPIDEKNSTETFVDSNWDQVFQNGGFWQNDLSISGGTDKSTYFFSLGRIEQEGIVRESDYDRTNLRLNNKFYFTDWLTMSSKASFTNTKSNRIQQNSNTAGLLLGLLRTPPDFDQTDYIGTYYDDDGNPTPLRQRSYRRYLGNNNNPTYNNPLWTIYEQTAGNKVNRFIFSSEIDIIPTDFLQFTLRGGIDTYDDKRDYFFPIGSAGDRQNGVFAQDVLGRQEINFDAIARANFNITRDISLNATIGWNINDRRLTSSSSSIRGFLVNARKETTDLNTAAEASAFESSRTNLRSNRGYTTLAFDFFDQVFFTAAGTLEAASTYPENFFYPAFDAAWQFSKIMGPSNVLSFGKLRAAWGQVGVAPPAHAAETLAEGGFTYSTYSDPLSIGLYGGGFRLDDDRGNPLLEPSIKTEWEIGADLRFMRDKLSVGMTYYQNVIDGIHINVELTPSFGYDSEVANAASMENKGFEVDLDYSILRNDDWDVGVYANWSRNVNEVTDLAGTETINLSPGASVSSRAIVGQPLGVLYGTGSQTDDNGNFILNEDGFPILTLSPIVLGDPNPEWRGGLGIRLSYKGFALNALVEHSQGGFFSPRTLHVLNRFGTTAVTANRVTLTEDLVNYGGDVIPAGTTVRGNIENFGGGNVLLDETWYRTGIGGGFGDNQAYNFSIYDASFTRFRELSLSYALRSNWVKEKLKLESIIIAATGRNLILWDEIPGVDPEINQTGVSNARGLDYFTNPSTASILFSLTVNY